MSDSEYFAELMAFARPEDHAMLQGLRGAYTTLRRIAKELSPDTVIEIGVRCGYSAFTLAFDRPVKIIGIEGDIDEVTRGCWREAERKLQDEWMNDIQVIVANSHDIRRLPEVDLIYIDGDHSEDGCYADLVLASASTKRILLDDWNSGNSVASGLARFVAAQPNWKQTYVPYDTSAYMILEAE